ncbi:MAG TPA: DUF3267 domain-containing protein [Candidatus Limiplasma sp.]|nr:DUF3267 domain-containing protein [Candidatus Limiplasma sp.]
MPKIVWVGCQKWDKAYPEAPLPGHAVQMQAPEHMLLETIKFAVFPTLLCFAALFCKRWICHAFPMDRRFVFWGILAGLLLIPVHEVLHAVCYPRHATVYIGLSPEKFAAFTVCHEPISKRRFIVMSLLPAVLGIVPLCLFILSPVSWQIASAVCWPAGMIGLVSPCQDYWDVHNVRKHVADGASIQSQNDGWYWYLPAPQSL